MNQVRFISLKRGLGAPASSLLHQPFETPLLPPLTIAPIPPWMLSEMKALACAGALVRAARSLRLCSFSLGIESGGEKRKESEYSSSSCTLQPFYTGCFDLVTARQRIKTLSSLYQELVSVFCPPFARTRLFACLNPSPPSPSPSAACRVFLFV